jgi:16S rRNA (cytidine1402-2'-O)-methyltransferase
MPGTLFVVPNLLGVVAPSAVLPARTLDAARSIAHWVVETPKAARAFLKSIDVGRPIAELSIVAMAAPAVDAALAALRDGKDVGLLSDAGCPGVADPGAVVVAAAHAARVRVVPLVGPSAVLLALMASGMNGQRFAFHGYLPVKPDARADALRALERTSRAEARTELFIETPYRNDAMLLALATALKAATRVCVAADLTLASETIECRTAAEWRSQDRARFDRRPAIFLLQA